MRWRIIMVAGAAIAAAAVAALVYAQLSNTQTASGTVNVTTISADLYICEPDSTPGPACGADDSGADETIFETLENIRPGEQRAWDIRLKNVGTEDWIVTTVTLNIVETIDPGNDCPDNALQAGRHPLANEFGDHPSSSAGVFILGNDGGPFNDNPLGLEGVPAFLVEQTASVFFDPRHIKVAAAGMEPVLTPTPGPGPTVVPPSVTAPFEDVRLRLELAAIGTENCDGNEWDVSWQFTVS